MKAFLLAAGSGNRLRPLTNETPKCLLPIRGVPLLAIWLEICRQSGIDEVLINASAHAAKIRAFVDSYKGGIDIHVVEERQLLGSAGTLADNRDFVRCEESFFVLYGDVLTDFSLEKIVAHHKLRRTPVTIGVYQVPDPQRCGIVTCDQDGIVRSFIEKPTEPESKLAFSGIMMANPEVIDLVPVQRPSDIGFHLLPQLIGRMSAYPIDTFLIDIGTMENYWTAQSSWPGVGEELRKKSACCKA